MAKYLIHALDKPGTAPYAISPTLRKQLQYFTTGEIRDSSNPDEFFFPLERTSELLDVGVFYVVSPLDDQHQAEIEISDEQEDLLDWLVSNGIQHVKVAEA
jgi:hypothetical protein